MFRLNLFTINQQFRPFMLLIAVKLAVTNEDPEANRFVSSANSFTLTSGTAFAISLT